LVQFGGAGAGCASKPEGPVYLTISSSDYAAVFDAAVEAARRDGLPAALRDRRGGVIETQTRMAGSVLEPWRTDDSATQALENTVSYQRRRARFEFVPAGFSPPDAATTTQPLSGPDVVNAEDTPLDLTAAEGELELRVWVYLERATIPGQRRSTWTRSKTTQALLVYPEGMEDRKSVQVIWTPVARDNRYEKRLLANVQKVLAEQSPARPSQPVAENQAPVAMMHELSSPGTE
jgi:hypothetical protein